MHLLAPGKINLTLHVLDRRTDGYHNVSSVMQTIRWADSLEIDLTDRSGVVELSVENHTQADVPTGETNLVHRAATAILSATGSGKGAAILLEKYLPVQAGLGGGSSDAAATLAGINRLLGDLLTHADVLALAARLGGDVPFFLTGGTCLVEGIGERVTPLPDFSPRALVIVKPAIGVSTADAYAALTTRRAGHAVVDPAVWGGASMSNDFQEIVEELYPDVLAAKQALLEAGCKNALLCGSGSAVFGFIEPAGEYESPETTAVLSGIGKELSAQGLAVATTLTAARQELPPT